MITRIDSSLLLAESVVVLTALSPLTEWEQSLHYIHLGGDPFRSCPMGLHL